jgi:hypothetical protein
MYLFMHFISIFPNNSCISNRQSYDGMYSELLLIKHTSHVVGDDVILVGGGGNCFSFGTTFDPAFTIINTAGNNSDVSLIKPETATNTTTSIPNSLPACTTTADATSSIITNATHSDVVANGDSAPINTSHTSPRSLRIMDGATCTIDVFTADIYPKRQPVVFTGSIAFHHAYVRVVFQIFDDKFI